MSKKVLLVDSDRLFVQLLTEFLEDDGFKVITAYDGLEGLQSAREELPDFILVDLVLPKIDGARLCRYLKEDPRLAETPIVLLSGAASGAMPDLQQVGADAYILKVPFERLLGDVREALTRLQPLRWPRAGKELISGLERRISRTMVEQLLTSETDNLALLERMGDGVLKLDKDQNVVYANRAALKLTGRHELDIMGKSVFKLLGLDAKPDFQRAVQKVMESREREKIAVTVSHGGTAIEIVVTNSVEQGATTGAVLILHDVSHEGFLQTEKLRAMGVMASGIAHDFNNMLSVIVGTVEMLMARTKDPGIRNLADTIKKAALDGAETVRRIGEFSHVQTNESGFVAVDLNQVIRDAVELTKPRWKNQAQSQGMAIRIKTDLRPVGLVKGRPSELREVLVNLLFNAIEAMPEGGDIVVRTGKRDCFVVITVTDTGCGVSEDLKQRAFDPFFTTKGTEGSGLGLSVSYGIVRRHKGEISLCSWPGKGTKVVVKLPVADASKEIETREEPQPGTRGARILVIENDEGIRNMLVGMLGLGGHDVEAFASDREGLTAFQPGRYDVVFTSLGMPDMKHWEIAEAIKAQDSRVPVVLLTGRRQAINEEDAKASGIDFVLSKPVQYQQLMRLVESAVQLSEKV